MKYWSDIQNTLKDNIALGTKFLLFFLATYIFIMAEQYGIWKSPILILAIFSWFFLQGKTRYIVIWIALFSLLVFDLYPFYFRVGNHHFVLTFMVLSVILYFYHKRRHILLKNIQMLLVIVVATSAIQKLISSQFMSGEFYYYMMNRGFIFNVLHPLFSESLEVAKSNSDQIIELQATDPNLKESIVLTNIFPSLGLFSRIFSWITVAVEFIVAIAILWKPKSKWVHLLFIVLILSILCTRLETGFMALLAICGMFLCRNLSLRLLYAMIIIICMSLIIAKVGFH
ncbi:hypothetical protein [Winogradskyella costae]|uniref:hypothetical protein n=1 Tax=Winogradskyella costae TaxID=2697008 RepID=UPI0015C8E09B|nr:hypothetical protein [Winogradskyella costae]